MAVNVVLVVGGTVECNCAHALTVAFGSLAGDALPTFSRHVDVTRNGLNHITMMGQGVVFVCLCWCVFCTGARIFQGKWKRCCYFSDCAKRRELIYIFLSVNKSHEKAKCSNVLVTSCYTVRHKGVN